MEFFDYAAEGSFVVCDSCVDDCVWIECQMESKTVRMKGCIPSSSIDRGGMLGLSSGWAEALELDMAFASRSDEEARSFVRYRYFAITGTIS